jgi:2-polyprenyl-6-hydroxyphenyl methylase/3-demethylubiquinone-9 3-methyltransferase
VSKKDAIRCQEEAEAFDRQISERIAKGHIPDLRMVKPCDYFYNNSWRRPEYVKLDFGEQFELIKNALDNFIKRRTAAVQVLEIGCGPGYMSLELARAGHDVTGIDVSAKCIEIAGQFSEADPWKKSRGKLTYLQGDFFNVAQLQPSSFHAVVFVGSLHHFAEQQKVMDRVNELLHPKGIIIAHEPTRDRVTYGNAVFVHLLQVLLSACKGFYKHVPIPETLVEHNNQIEAIFSKQRYVNQNGGKVQSAHDNDSGHREMYGALKANFIELNYQERYAFFHEVIGGLRFDEETNAHLARYLRDADALLCEKGVLQSTEFFFVGGKRK